MTYVYTPTRNTDVFNKTTGKLLRKYREAAGYSQKGLSEASGLSQQHICQVEIGKRNLGFDHWYNLSLILGFSLNDVLDRINIPPTAVMLATADDYTGILEFDPLIPEDWLAHCIKEQQIYLLWTPDSMVGLCRYSLFKQEIPFLDFLYIDKHNRAKGFGTTLLEHWENAMTEMGHHRVMLAIKEHEGLEFFEKRNYQCIGSYYPSGQECEEFLYMKVLSE